MASEVRSGSTYAAELLAYAFADIKNLNFWDLTRETLSHISHTSTSEEILAELQAIWVNEAGFRSSKIMCAQLSILCREARKNPSLSRMLFDDDAYWLIVRRRDRIPQAVSLAFARNDGIFHAYSAEASATPPYVAMSDIDNALKAIALSDVFLDTFAMKPDRHMTVFYEDLMKDRPGFIRSVAAFIGAPVGETDFPQITAPKLTPTNRIAKTSKVAQFRTWLLDNYHDLG